MFFLLPVLGEVPLLLSQGNSVSQCAEMGFRLRGYHAFSIHLDVDIFSFTQCVRAVQLVSGIISRRNCSICSHRFGVSMQKVSSGASEVTMLAQNQ